MWAGRADIEESKSDVAMNGEPNIVRMRVDLFNDILRFDFEMWLCSPDNFLYF